jgi:hypothetical protein
MGAGEGERAPFPCNPNPKTKSNTNPGDPLDCLVTLKIGTEKVSTMCPV